MPVAEVAAVVNDDFEVDAVAAVADAAGLHPKAGGMVIEST